MFNSKHEEKDETFNRGSLTRMAYTLDQVVVLSRHNIRSPLVGSGSVLGDITPNEWVTWSSDPSELSVRGGVLETEMGQFFRKWLEAEGLFEKNEKPAKNEIRIYANSKQRTIATARFFSTGLLPTANAKVEYKAEYDKMDPIFNPQLTFVSDEYNADAEKQVWELYSDTVGKLNYEEPDALKAAFGHELTQEQWEAIAEIKDVYGDMLFTSPLIATNVAHPLLQEIQKEMLTKGRKFTFLCGHDSNIGSVLAALGAEDYSLPYTIEKKTPIGCKLVFCRWHDKNGKNYCSLDLVYQTTDQLRGVSLLDLNQSPVTVPITLRGLDTVGDRLYAEDPFMARLQEAIDEYDKIIKKYATKEDIKTAA